MHYLVSVLNTKNGGKTDTGEEMTAIDTFNEKLEKNGNWVFGYGLGSKATVIDNRGDEPVVTDGPFLESKEFIAGLWIMKAADLDEALALGTEASKACNRRIEVRPCHGE